MTCFFTSGSTSDPNNFRLVSILPSFSKIFEKNILNQILLHFNSHILMHKKHYDITKGRSATDAGIRLT